MPGPERAAYLAAHGGGSIAAEAAMTAAGTAMAATAARVAAAAPPSSAATPDPSGGGEEEWSEGSDGVWRNGTVSNRGWAQDREGMWHETPSSAATPDPSGGGGGGANAPSSSSSAVLWVAGALPRSALLHYLVALLAAVPEAEPVALRLRRGVTGSTGATAASDVYSDASDAAEAESGRVRVHVCARLFARPCPRARLAARLAAAMCSAPTEDGDGAPPVFEPSYTPYGTASDAAAAGVAVALRGLGAPDAANAVARKHVDNPELKDRVRALTKDEAGNVISALHDLGNVEDADGNIDAGFMEAVGFGTLTLPLPWPWL